MRSSNPTIASPPTVLPPWYGKGIGFSLALLLLLPCPPAFGQALPQVTTAITSDGTLGTIVIPKGPIHEITGGTRPGNGTNLFHSFGQFSVGSSDMANFLNDSGLPTNNILSRVTGGDPSHIFGTIQTTDFGSANLFLLNPDGVIFGPSAKLNVGGSFHVTTADYLRFPDGHTFRANPSSNEILSVGDVTGIRFYGRKPQSH